MQNHPARIIQGTADFAYQMSRCTRSFVGWRHFPLKTIMASSDTVLQTLLRPFRNFYASVVMLCCTGLTWTLCGRWKVLSLRLDHLDVTPPTWLVSGAFELLETLSWADKGKSWNSAPVSLYLTNILFDDIHWRHCQLHREPRWEKPEAGSPQTKLQNNIRKGNSDALSITLVTWWTAWRTPQRPGQRHCRNQGGITGDLYLFASYGLKFNTAPAVVLVFAKTLNWTETAAPDIRLFLF